MKIISWNMQGLGSRRKIMVVKDFLQHENPDIVKRKREVCDRRFVSSVWTTRNKAWTSLPTCGASGGVLII